MDEPSRTSGPATVAVEFLGPFAWIPTLDVASVFDAVPEGTAGLYLWTIDRGDGHLVFYVGETGRCIRMRLGEHYAEHCAGRYSIHEPSAFARGEKSCLWPGYYGKSGRELGECVAASIELAGKIAEITRMMRFFVAPTDCDKRTRRRMEAAIADAIARAPGAAGAFQEPGVRYERRRADETPIEIRFRCNSTLLGLPAAVAG